MIVVVEVRGNKLLIPIVGGAVGGVLAIAIVLVLVVISSYYHCKVYI